MREEREKFLEGNDGHRSSSARSVRSGRDRKSFRNDAPLKIAGGIARRASFSSQGSGNSNYQNSKPRKIEEALWSQDPSQAPNFAKPIGVHGPHDHSDVVKPQPKKSVRLSVSGTKVLKNTLTQGQMQRTGQTVIKTGQTSTTRHSTLKSKTQSQTTKVALVSNNKTIQSPTAKNTMPR